MGISSVEAVGNVYNLTKNKAFNSQYTAVSASAALAGGGSVATMRNQHGVVLGLTGISRGAKLTLAVEGVKITLSGPETTLKEQ